MYKLAVAMLTVAFVPSVAMAQSVSGEVGVYSSYLDDDLFQLTHKPVVQAGISLDVSKHCTVDAWGSHGFSTSEGAELDLGASCRFSLDQQTIVEVTAARYFLHGLNDMTAVSIGITHGPIDVTLTQYIWDNNPDATRIVAGYTIDATERLSLRPLVVYETGFGEADILAGGLRAEYVLTDKFTLVGLALTPIKKGGGDTRSTEASIGIRFNF